MNAHQEENDMIAKSVLWASKASDAIRDAGGSATSVLKTFSEESLVMLVRNGLDIKYGGKQ